MHTYLTRMESKGLVKNSSEREPHQYAAAVSREACAQQEPKQLLDKVYNGAAESSSRPFEREPHDAGGTGPFAGCWMRWRYDMENIWSFLLQTLSVSRSGSYCWW